ncbi:MAG TPA: oxygenase MpaB family protein, partial [Mycobacterium sp.]|nr:oxygenase MpaB family protein [Mycobacterium sp.]
RISAYRKELHGTDAAREAARFLLLTPPLPLLARVPYSVLASAAVAMLPAWARMPLRLPYLPPVEATGIRFAGRALVGTIRWAMSANQPETTAVQSVSSEA